MSIRNQGNTCYLGAALQCLVRNRCFHEFLSACWKQETAEGRQFVTFAYKLLSNSSTSSTKTLKIDPSSLYASLRRFYPFFKEFEEHDSHEALMVLIDYLNRYLVSMPGTMFQVKSRRAHRAWIERPLWPSDASAGPCPLYTVPDEIFKMQVRTKIKCSKCAHTRRTYENEYGIYDNFSCGDDGTEIVDGYRCENCKTMNSCTKATRIVHFPQTLVVRVKAVDPVCIDADITDTMEMCLVQDRSYRLRSMCLFVPENKHYMALVDVNVQRADRRRRWVLFNDELDPKEIVGDDWKHFVKYSSMLVYELEAQAEAQEQSHTHRRSS